MTERLELYKCEICGNIVEVLHRGKGQLVCCGQPMGLLEEKGEERGREKHLPVTKRADRGVTVEVGSIPHPMESDHYIEWVEVITEEGVLRRFLEPGMPPRAKFEIEGDIRQVRIYCNLHGLWTT